MCVLCAQFAQQLVQTKYAMVNRTFYLYMYMHVHTVHVAVGYWYLVRWCTLYMHSTQCIQVCTHEHIPLQSTLMYMYMCTCTLCACKVLWVGLYGSYGHWWVNEWAGDQLISSQKPFLPPLSKLLQPHQCMFINVIHTHVLYVHQA